MGNDNSTKVDKVAYKPDQKLIDRTIMVPQSFPGKIEGMINEVVSIYNNNEKHPLQDMIIKSISQRFQYEIIENQQTNKISSSDIEKKEKTKKQQALQKLFVVLHDTQWIRSQNTWHQLSTLQNFFKFLEHTQYIYNIQLKLKNSNQQFRPENQQYFTIRKPIRVTYTSQICKALFIRLFLFYYTLCLKKSLASNNKNIKNEVLNFHQNIGKQLCSFLKYDKLSEKQLSQITYHTIFIERHMQLKKIQQSFEKIKDSFQKKCLKHQHSVKLLQQDYERLKKISRCYLDQLYFLCVKQAQDPQLGTSQPTLGQLRGFPISRVKEKNRIN